MVDDYARAEIELQAARLAVEWQHLFAAQLMSAAEQVAHGSAMITVDHYREALPAALASVLDSVKKQMCVSTNAHRKIA